MEEGARAVYVFAERTGDADGWIVYAVGADLIAADEARELVVNGVQQRAHPILVTRAVVPAVPLRRLAGTTASDELEPRAFGCGTGGIRHHKQGCQHNENNHRRHRTQQTSENTRA